MKPATLLARKCFLSPVPEEIEALLSLGLDIEWEAEGNKNKTLAESAVIVIRDELLFKRFWSKLGLSAWEDFPSFRKDPLSMIAMGVLDNRFGVVETLLKEEGGSKKDWEKFLALPEIKAWSLSPSFNKLKNIKQIPNFVCEELSSYRTENLWLLSKNSKELKESVPVWNHDRSFKWAHHAASLAAQSQSDNEKKINMWATHSLVNAQNDDKSYIWQKWTEKEWLSVWLAFPAGWLGWSILPDGKPNPLYTEFVEKYSPSAPSAELLELANKEIKHLFHISPKGDRSSYGFGFDMKFPLYHTKIKKRCNMYLDVLEQSQDPSILASAALLRAQMSFMNAPTKPDPKVVGLFANHPDMILQEINNYPLKKTNQRFIAFLAAHMSLSNPSEKWQNELWGVTEKAQKLNLEEFSTSMMSWGTQMASDKNQSKNIAALGAEIFWRNVFFIPPANQHYWLKKASGFPGLCEKLSFWDEEFSQKLTDAAERRKKTKEISALLTKMNLYNSIDNEKSTIPKQRKM